MEVGIARWLTPTNPYPRSMLSSTLIRGQVKFCNKYMSSLWLTWVHGHTHTHPSTLLAFIMSRNLSPVPYTHHYLPQNSHHTYLLWNFHSHYEIYCHATFHRSIYYDTRHHFHIALHDHVVDIVFVAKPPFMIFIHVTLDSLHISVHHRRHSHRLIFCSKYWVVILEL